MTREIARTLLPAALSLLAAAAFQQALAEQTRQVTAANSAPATGRAVARPADGVPAIAAARRHFDAFTQGTRSAAEESPLVAGLDRTGVCATPQRRVDPYADGAMTTGGHPRKSDRAGASFQA